LSIATAVAIAAENGAKGGVLSLNNVNSANPTRKMDDIDDRLFSAVIRNGHLWTAHNVAVDASGNSNGGTATRDAVRWYDVTVSGLTLHQSGTVFDAATTGFLEYWMGTVMVSGQGHASLGLNRANSSTVVQAGAVGRLATDPLGTMGNFSIFRNSTTDGYSDKSLNPNPINRWGDFTYTSLDPCDDMTMWTTQEYVAGPSFSGVPIDWGVAAEKLLSPPPATPSSAIPSSVSAGQSSVSVVITGTSTNGSGFYDTPSTITDPCRKRISASVSGGVTVNSVSYTDPTHVTLNISTVGATAGSQTVTITNPDGQTSAAAVLTVASSQAPQGNWVNAYGGDGYDLLAWNGGSDLASMPKATVVLDQGLRFQWSSSTTAVQALESPDTTSREAACFYDASQVRVHLSFPAAYSGTLHLYAVDWDSTVRRETITVNDGSGPQTAIISTDFSQGAWVNVPINVAANGTVTISVASTAGANAVLSGIFLG
jgi:hypothetical protein